MHKVTVEDVRKRIEEALPGARVQVGTFSGDDHFEARVVAPQFEGVPVGPTFQIIVAITAHAVANREYLKANEFTFFPVKEVGLLFVGIFATMAPALGYLAAHGDALGLTSPTAFYYLLSAALFGSPSSAARHCLDSLSCALAVLLKARAP